MCKLLQLLETVFKPRYERALLMNVAPGFEASGVLRCGLHGELYVRLTLLCTCPEYLNPQLATRLVGCGPQMQLW